MNPNIKQTHFVFVQNLYFSQFLILSTELHISRLFLKENVCNDCDFICSMKIQYFHETLYAYCCSITEFPVYVIITSILKTCHSFEIRISASIPIY